MAVPDGDEALIGSVLTLVNPASAGFFHGQTSCYAAMPSLELQSTNQVRINTIKQRDGSLTRSTEQLFVHRHRVFTMSTPLFETTLTSLPLLARGKVRDNYAVGDDKLLMIATDRLSAFDVVMREPIPGKGQLLTQMSNFWFNELAGIVPNHLTGDNPESVVLADECAQVRGRSVLVKRLQPLPIEAVVRGFLAGSGWKEYQVSQSICGVRLPSGLRNSAKLPQPIFTPASKAEQGGHDENITFERMCEVVGESVGIQVRDIALRLYSSAASIAQSKGMMIADTKFEFGLDSYGTLTLMDEALTPDSSRFWPVEGYAEGTTPASFDKQFVRDWLESAVVNGRPWNKRSPAPSLPIEVIDQTAAKYREALERLLS